MGLGSFRVLPWIFDYKMAVAQRSFVAENGYSAFVAGMMLGILMFWRLFRGGVVDVGARMPLKAP